MQIFQRKAQAMRTTWTFSSAGQIIFGPGAVEQLGDVVGRLGLKRMLVVTDARLVEAGLSAEVATAAARSAATLDVFAGGEPEPSLRVAEKCIGAGPRVSARWPDRPGRRQQHGPGQDDRHGAGARRLAARLPGRRPRARADRCP